MNGGAQIRPQNNTQPRELATILETQYQQLPLIKSEDNLMVNNLYKMWFGEADSEKALSFLHTQYNAIEKTNIALTMKW